MTDTGLVVSQVLGVTIVNFHKSSILDAQTVDWIARELYVLVDEQARRKIILDLRHVRFLSSTILGVLVALQKKSQAIKGKLVICGLRPDLSKVFKITKLDKLFEFADGEDEAMRRFDILANP